MIDIQGILDILPHRYPFLLVDRVLELEKGRIVALKNVTFNEPHFPGHFPGVPVIPAMSTGATDGVYLSAVGIPTYGVPSVWTDPDGNGTHGLNERVEVKALYAARAYLYDLVKTFGG